MKRILPILIFVCLTTISTNLLSQSYQLVWEDNFDGTTLDSSKWNIEQRVGVWNTGGNGELEHYRKENVTVGDDGDGNNCLIITAKKENYNGYGFTSGRINTKGKFAFRRGKIEAMIKVPDLANGLWPAFWTLGYTEKGWPDCGEIDILEMGHEAGILDDTVNSFIGTHLFWGPYPRDNGDDSIVSSNLSKGYFKHTVKWDEKNIKTYFNDAPYYSMGITGTDAEEFRDYMHYVILNLAVGGSVPNITNAANITAPLPANMYVDWVKVYQLEGSEDYNDSSLALFGTIGVYEETVPSTMTIDLGYDATVETSGLSDRAGETPKEGTKVLSYNATAGNDFKFAFNSDFPRNLSNYANGSIQFWFKTEALDSIQIGVSDAAGNEAFITLKDGVKMNPTRDGVWSFSWIPLSELDAEIDLSAIKSFLIVKGNFDQNSYVSIDKITLEESVPAIGYYGIYTNNPAITNKLVIDDVTGHIYKWSGSEVFNSIYPAYEGRDVLSLNSPGPAGWYGFGIFTDNPVNLETYKDGYLNLMLRTNSTKDFWIGVAGAGDTEARFDFISGNDPYDFVRDGNWHQLVIPVSDMLAKGIDLSGCDNIFMLGGGNIERIAVDDIYFSEELSTIENSVICYPASIAVTPATATIDINTNKTLTATIKDQFTNKTDYNTEELLWSADGGTITDKGVFSSTEEGEFTVTATYNELSASAAITVQHTNSVTDAYGNSLTLFPNPVNGMLNIKGVEGPSNIILYDQLGKEVLVKELDNDGTIDMSNLSCGMYTIHIKNSQDIRVFHIVKN